MERPNVVAPPPGPNPLIALAFVLVAGMAVFIALGIGAEVAAPPGQPPGADGITVLHLHAGLLGAMAALAVVSLALGVSLAQPLCFHLTGFVVALSVSWLIQDGRGGLWPRGWNEDTIRHTATTVQCLSGLVATLLFNSLFDFSRQWRIGRRVVEVAVGFYAAAAVLSVFGLHEWIALPMRCIDLALRLVALMFIGQLLLARRQWQYLLPAMAFIAPLLLGTANTLHMLGWGARNLGDIHEAWARHGVRFTYMALMTLAVLHRLRRDDQALRHQLHDALAQARQAHGLASAQVQAQTAELSLVNDKLRAQVDHRRQLMNDVMQLMAQQQGVVEQQRHFVAIVSHEFRTPLSVIDGAAQSLQVSPLADHDLVRPRMERIRRSVERLGALLDNVLLEERMERGIGQQPHDHFTTHDWIACTLERVEESSRQRFETRLDAAPATVFAVRDLLEIALLNLLQNALRYSPAGSPVRIESFFEPHARGGPVAGVRVANLGTPIPPDDAARIFDKHVRGSTHGAQRGTGLGLYIARVAARHHDGDVQLLPHEDGWVRFEIRLPAATAPAG